LFAQISVGYASFGRGNKSQNVERNQHQQRRRAALGDALSGVIVVVDRAELGLRYRLRDGLGEQFGGDG
jgi:hypothetical protein